MTRIADRSLMWDNVTEKKVRISWPHLKLVPIGYDRNKF